MSLRYALLALLAEGEAHGYRLRQGARRRGSGPCWHPNIGQVYQLLHELERRGWIVHRRRAPVPPVRAGSSASRRAASARCGLARAPAGLAATAARRDLRAPAGRRTPRHRRGPGPGRPPRGGVPALPRPARGAGGRASGSMARELAHEAALAHAHAHLRWLARCRRGPGAPRRRCRVVTPCDATSWRASGSSARARWRRAIAPSWKTTARATSSGGDRGGARVEHAELHPALDRLAAEPPGSRPAAKSVPPTLWMSIVMTRTPCAGHLARAASAPTP